MEEWTPDPANQSDIEALECEIGGPGSKGTTGPSGWAAEDMFKTNTSKFGTRTDYDTNLTGYTVELDRTETTLQQVITHYNAYTGGYPLSTHSFKYTGPL